MPVTTSESRFSVGDRVMVNQYGAYTFTAPGSTGVVTIVDPGSTIIQFDLFTGRQPDGFSGGIFTIRNSNLINVTRGEDTSQVIPGVVDYSRDGGSNFYPEFTLAIEEEESREEEPEYRRMLDDIDDYGPVLDRDDYFVGDEVIMVGWSTNDSESIPLETRGVVEDLTIDGHHEELDVWVTWEQGETDGWWVPHQDIRLISAKGDSPTPNPYNYSKEELRVVRKIKQMDKRFNERRVA